MHPGIAQLALFEEGALAGFDAKLFLLVVVVVRVNVNKPPLHLMPVVAPGYIVVHPDMWRNRRPYSTSARRPTTTY
jgi:hypothetical protein